MWSLGALLIGCVIDLLVGDPQGLPHPVVGIGKLISALETLFRKWFPSTKNGERLAGLVLWVLICGISTAVPALVLCGLRTITPWLSLAAESIMCWQILAARSLREESMKVYHALKTGDLSRARKTVSMIVGRDTEHLDDAGVTRAAVETVAENTSDGVIAPMLYTALGGPVLGFFYKAVNTMDSMVGYKNEKYLYFGRAAAKLDDAMNYLPSRISVGLMLMVCLVDGTFDFGQALRIYRRDRRKHASPNSAQTESVCAGALGLKLAGPASYFGRKVDKPYIGEELRSIEPEDIRRVNRLMYGTAWLCEVLCVALLGGVWWMLSQGALP